MGTNLFCVGKTNQMVEQKVAWTSNRPGFGTAQHHLAVCSTAAFFFLEIFILSSTFKMNAEFEKEREQKKKRTGQNEKRTQTHPKQLQAHKKCSR